MRRMFAIYAYKRVINCSAFARHRQCSLFRLTVQYGSRNFLSHCKFKEGTLKVIRIMMNRCEALRGTREMEGESYEKLPVQQILLFLINVVSTFFPSVINVYLLRYNRLILNFLNFPQCIALKLSHYPKLQKYSNHMVFFMRTFSLSTL